MFNLVLSFLVELIEMVEMESNDLIQIGVHVIATRE